MNAAAELVIIAYDGSKAARRAVAEAAKVMSSCRFLLVTVWEEGLAYMPMPTAQVDGMTPMTQPVDPVVARDVDRSLHEEAESVCRDGINLARSLGIDAQPLVVPDSRV